MPARARDWLRATLPTALSRATADPDLLGDAEVVVSELTTNAMRARCTTTTVGWEVDGASVVVSVSDDADGWPLPVTAAADDQQGRGLQIVGALARQWGVHREHHGKRTWARLNVSAY